MTTVRDATFDFLRRRGMTTMFGNPGSTELPMLAEFPDDFRYVLGLQEAVAVGHGRRLRAGERAADARQPAHRARRRQRRWARSSTPRPTSAPLLVTAGQQARSLMTLQANLTNRDAARMPHPLVKWSYEPPRAEDVPHALARAIHLASLPPRGPGVRVDPDGRLGRRGRRRAPSRTRSRAHVTGRAQPPTAEVARDLAERLRARRATRCSSPAPTSTPAAAGTPRSRSPSASACRCGPRRAPGGGRIGFPEDHPLFQGILPPAVGPLGETLAGHDLVLVVGLLGVPLLPEHPRPAAARGHRARGDHQRPRRGRARADGRRDRRRRRR